MQFIKGLISVWDKWLKTMQAGYRKTHNIPDASNFLHDLPKALTVFGPEAASVELGTQFPRQLCKATAHNKVSSKTKLTKLPWKLSARFHVCCLWTKHCQCFGQVMQKLAGIRSIMSLPVACLLCLEPFVPDRNQSLDIKLLHRTSLE